MARSSPTSWAVSTSKAASSRLRQYCSLLASAELKSSNAISPPSSTSTRSPSRLPCATPAAWRSWSCCHAEPSTLSVSRSGGSDATGVPDGGVVTSTAASAPPTPVPTNRAACTSARSASINVKPMCSTCWMRLPNTGTPGSWYIARCHTLAAMRASRWSRPNASTRTCSPEPSSTSITDARATRSSALVIDFTSYPMSVSALVTSVTEGRPPGEPNATRTSAATAKPTRMPPSTSAGNPAPRYIAARDTRRMTRPKMRRSGRTR